MEDLTYLTEVEPSKCGCLWRRTKEFGDVVIQQCDRHDFENALSRYGLFDYLKQFKAKMDQ